MTKRSMTAKGKPRRKRAAPKRGRTPWLKCKTAMAAAFEDAGYDLKGRGTVSEPSWRVVRKKRNTT